MNMTSALGLFTYCAVMYAIACLGVAIGYHRMLVHRSFAAHRWLARTVVTFGLPAGTPVQWTGNHRWHHAIADRLGDTHSAPRPRAAPYFDMTLAPLIYGRSTFGISIDPSGRW